VNGETFGFDEALGVLKAGGRVRRQGWRPGLYLQLDAGLEDAFIAEFSADHASNGWRGYSYDLLAVDWMVAA